MTAARTMWMVLAVAGGMLMMAGEAESARVTLPRPGQVGLGLQGQYGSFLNSGGLGSEFGPGPGLAVRLRYRMRFERAIGFSFENQAFDVRDQADSVGSITKATLITSGLEIYQLFGTRSATQRMLSVGLGLAQVSQDTNDGGTIFPGDGFYVSVGAGVERFFWNSWAWDLSGRYMSVFQDGETNHDLQLSAGVIFYASY